VPIFKSESGGTFSREIDLLDPSDMLPFVFEIRSSSDGKEHSERGKYRI